MEKQEYTDGYQPPHPELIPESWNEADFWITAAIMAGVNKCDKQTFLKAWWAFAWLNPSFHPDNYLDFDQLPLAKELSEESIHRVEIGEIDEDSEFYATEATHNAVWLELCQSSFAPSRFTDG